MSGTMPVGQFELDLQAASILFDTDPDARIARARANLADLALPLYYVIENCMLIASAMDIASYDPLLHKTSTNTSEENWSDAEIWRLSAEQAYNTSLAKATRMNDTPSLDLLKNVREDLDELEAKMIDDLTGMTKEERDARADAYMPGLEPSGYGLGEGDEAEEGHSAVDVDVAKIEGGDFARGGTQLPIRQSHDIATDL